MLQHRNRANALSPVNTKRYRNVSTAEGWVNYYAG